MNDAELLAYVEKAYFKINEICAIMKKGEFIPAYEKLGGVLKNFSNLRSQLIRNLNEQKTPNSQQSTTEDTDKSV
jgi:hypothetical protein